MVAKRVLIRIGRVAALLAIVLLLGGSVCYLVMVRMPGTSYRGELPALTDAQRGLADELRGHVDMLATEIGPRSPMNERNYQLARTYLREQLESYGYHVTEQAFQAGGTECANVIASTRAVEEGSSGAASGAGEVIVIGAHYDSCYDSPAANDNGSGCAAVLALAKRLAPGGEDPPHDETPGVENESASPREVRFVLFANEEPPWFLTDQMGSLVYARSCAARGDDIKVMISLETIGYFSDAPGSQQYPIKPLEWFYPTQGDFIAFVSNVGSRRHLRTVVGAFRKHAAFPSQGAALPGNIPGVGWSDHWAFWQVGYPAIMVTDTAPFRYPHYHTRQDTAEKLDYPRMARVVEGLDLVLRELRGD